MGRWIAFDEESTAVAATQSGMAVSFQRGDALDCALAAVNPALVLMPGSSREELLVVEVRRPISQRSTPSAPQGSRHAGDVPVAYEATGFLGLIDEPIFEDQPQSKKKWWRRLLD